jgi:molybdate transport system ATP-binding protein
MEFSERSTTSGDWLEIQGRHHSTPVPLRSIGYAPQGAVLFPHLSVRENIAFASQARRSPDDQSIAAAIDLFELGRLAHRMPRDLSGGERQRVNLARAFAVPAARLLLLDEPFTGVDRNLRDTLLPRMQQHAAKLGLPVLSVTHDVEEALLLGAEVVRIEQGAVIDQGPASRVLADERARMLSVLEQCVRSPAV